MQDKIKAHVNRDIFVTESLDLISLIYKFAEKKGISEEHFEEIIRRSYERVWNIPEEKAKHLLGSVTQQQHQQGINALKESVNHAELQKCILNEVSEVVKSDVTPDSQIFVNY